MNLLLDTPGGTGLYLSFNAMSWLFVTILITIACWQIAREKKLYWNNIHLWLILGCLFLAVPFAYEAPFKDHNILKYLGVIGGLLLLISCSQFKKFRINRNRLLWLILIAVVIQSLATLNQLLLIEPSDSYWFDPEKHRPFGLFIQPNILGTFLATGVAISLYLLAKYPFSNYKISILSVVVGLCAFVIPATESLSGYYSLILVCLLALPQLICRRKSLALGQFLLILVAFSSSNLGYSEPESSAPIPDRNVEVRKDIYWVSSLMIIEQPITGYGYGSFERSYLDFHNKLRVEDPTMSAPLLKLDHPHNEVLYWGVEGGLSALCGIILFVIGYLRLFKSAPLLKRCALLGLVLPIVFHSQVELPFDSAASHWHILILLVFFTMMELRNKTHCLLLPSGFSPTVIGSVISFIFLPFLITTMHTTAIVSAHETNRHQRIETFKSIINPLPLRERINANINAHKLIVGFREKDAALLNQYVEWAKLQVKHKPRVAIYQDLLLSLKVLGRDSEYEHALAEAKKTYPDEPNWSQSGLLQSN